MPAPFDESIFDEAVFDAEVEVVPVPPEDDYNYPIGRGIWDDYGLRASIAKYRAGRTHRF